MVETIIVLIFAGSVAGMFTIVARKMPTAKQASERSADFKLANLVSGLKNWLETKIKKTPYFKNFSWIDFTQKQLLKAKLLILKAENKINDYMVRLRQRAEEQGKKDEALLDNYWHDLRTIVKTKKPILVKKNSKSEADKEIMISEADKPVAAKKTVARLETEFSAKTELPEMAVGKVVMPEDVIEKPAHHQKKKRANSKRRRLRDPFSW